MYGRSKTAYTSVCINNDITLYVRFKPNQGWAESLINVTPFEGIACADTDLLHDLTDQPYIGSCFDSPEFRKLIQLYKQVRLKGMYASLTPCQDSTFQFAPQFINVYTAWDRMAKPGAGSIYLGKTTLQAFENLRNTCRAQGSGKYTWMGGKGKMAIRTRCIARGAENTAWVDTQCDTDEFTSTNYKGTEFFLLQLWASGHNTILNQFNPMLTMGFDTPYVTNTNRYLYVQLSIKYFLEFREPGFAQPDLLVIQDLDKRNDQLAPVYVPPTKEGEGEPPTKKAKKETETEEADKAVAAAVSAKGKEGDDDDENMTLIETQVLDESTLL